jgi:hypothetical protein
MSFGTGAFGRCEIYVYMITSDLDVTILIQNLLKSCIRKNQNLMEKSVIM